MKKLNVKSILYSIAILLGLTLALGCKCDSDVLLSNSWVLEKYGSPMELVEVMDASQVTPPGKTEILLQFSEENKLNGNDGCNLISGVYKMDERCQIQFDSTITTLMMCGPEIMEQAGSYNQLFGNVKSYKIYNDILDLRTDDNKILRYKKK